jgi:methionyl-tRNA formyltransferase
LPQQLLILTGELEAAQLGPALRPAVADDLQLAAISSLAELEAAGERGLSGTRLISFCTRIIVPPAILNALTLEPYNIHPGSPDYPGLYPEAFAIYHEANRFAATAHAMTREVDAGPIVRTGWFDVPPHWQREQLAERVYRKALDLFFEIALVCATSDAALPRGPEDWSGPRRGRADYLRMCTSTGDRTEDERRLRAFAPDFPRPPVG